MPLLSFEQTLKAMITATPYSYLRELKATIANEQEKLQTIKSQLAQDGAFESVALCRDIEKMIEAFKDQLELKKTPIS